MLIELLSTEIVIVIFATFNILADLRFAYANGVLTTASWTFLPIVLAFLREMESSPPSPVRLPLTAPESTKMRRHRHRQ